MANSTLGKHIKRLREVRGMTQEQLAECSGVAADTIRRLEKENFSPSLRTLRKVCKGLRISLSTLFGGFELPVVDPVIVDLVGLLEGRSPQMLRVVARVVRELLSLLDGQLDQDRRGGRAN